MYSVLSGATDWILCYIKNISLSFPFPPQLIEKRAAVLGANLPSTEVRSKKMKAPKKRKKKDPNEPQK